MTLATTLIPTLPIATSLSPLRNAMNLLKAPQTRISEAGRCMSFAFEKAPTGHALDMRHGLASPARLLLPTRPCIEVNSQAPGAVPCWSNIRSLRSMVESQVLLPGGAVDPGAVGYRGLPWLASLQRLSVRGSVDSGELVLRR